MPENTQNETTPDFDFEAVAPKVTIGQAVQYISTKGKVKAALVVGTPDTVEEGTHLPALLPGQLHLAVFTWSVGTFIPRLQVPFEGLGAQTDDEGNPKGFWKLV